MRILIVAGEAPTGPVSGFRLVLRELLAGLAGDHDVHTLALRMPDQPPAPSDATTLVPWPGSPLRDVVDLARSLPRGRPLRPDQIGRVLRGPLRQHVRDLDPDVVHVVHHLLAPLGAELRDRPTVLTALDAWYRNVEASVDVSRGVRRRLLRGRLERVRAYEARDYARFDRVTVVTDEDRAALHALNPALSIDVVPNGVDSERFTPVEAERDDRRVTFHGVLDYPPNIAAARFLALEVLPGVRAEIPEARLALVGRRPAPQIEALDEEPGVDVVGSVPDIPPWLTSTRVYACGMVSGTGIKNKLLEAMACGAACVVTPLATQGLDAVDGRDYLVADGAASFAAATVRVLRDDALQRELGASARRYVVDHHSWPAVIDRYVEIYRAVRS